MANRFYLKGLQNFDKGNINAVANNLRACLAKVGYVPDTSATGDQFRSSVGAGNIVATSPLLTGKTDAGGNLVAANITFAAVSGAQCVYIVLYVDTGNIATDYLILLIDTAVNLPITPNGGDIGLAWDVANGVYTL